MELSEPWECSQDPLTQPSILPLVWRDRGSTMNQTCPGFLLGCTGLQPISGPRLVQKTAAMTHRNAKRMSVARGHGRQQDVLHTWCVSKVPSLALGSCFTPEPTRRTRLDAFYAHLTVVHRALMQAAGGLTAIQGPPPSCLWTGC